LQIFSSEVALVRYHALINVGAYDPKSLIQSMLSYSVNLQAKISPKLHSASGLLEVNRFVVT